MRCLIQILLIICFFHTKAQKVDTLNSYYTKYSSSTTEKASRYGRTFTVYKLGYPVKIDSSYQYVYEEVTKEEYDVYQKQILDIGNCKPCWKRSFRENGNLYYEGLLFTDCPIGILKSYDETGQLVQISMYKSISSNSICSIKDGEWYYYLKGKKVKTEVYKDDILISTIIH